MCRRIGVHQGWPLPKPRRRWDDLREQDVATVLRAMVLLDRAAAHCPSPAEAGALRQTAVGLRLMLKRWERDAND